MLFSGLVTSGMGKIPKKFWPPLFVAEWIKATGYQQHEVVKATGYSQSYISNLSGGRKKNPGGLVLLRISEFIGITMNDFYRPPPPDAQVAALSGISPQARDALMRARNRRQ